MLICLSALTVFAIVGKPKTFDSLELYIDTPSGYIPMAAGAVDYLQLSTTQQNPSDPQTQLTDASGDAYPLVHFNGSTYEPVFSKADW